MMRSSPRHDPSPVTDQASEAPRRGPTRKLVAMAAGGGTLLALVAGGLWLNRGEPASPRPTGGPVPATVRLAGVTSSERLFRVDPNSSQITVEVEEKLAGRDVSTATLVTKAVSGEIAFNALDPSDSRVGEIVADVSQLTSDNSLRDSQLRHKYLDTEHHRYVRLSDVSLANLPERLPDGEEVSFEFEADLTVKDITQPTTWTATGSVSGDTIKLEASAEIALEDFDAGPISIVGLVSTSDTAKVTVKLTARDADSFAQPERLSGRSGDGKATATSADAPSFRREVAPILSENCAGCHAPNGIGNHTWSLETAADAAAVADGLAVVTESRFMPPWPAGGDSPEFEHERHLTDEEIDTIGRWASAGAPLDVEDDSPISAPDAPEIALEREDLRVGPAEPYVGSVEHPNDYRCVILDPKLTEPKFITGSYFDPDADEIVHHVLIYKQSAPERAEFEARDAADDKPGWPCSTGSGARGGGANVGGWVPGIRPAIAPEGYGTRVEPGDFFVAQMHYHYDDFVPPDQSEWVLQLEDGSAGLKPLRGRTLVAPVELPCPAGSTEPLCDRTAALADLNRRYENGSITANLLHGGCGTTPESVAANSDGITARTVCDDRVTHGGTVIGVNGHMHELGASFRMVANPGTTREKVLLDIPTWNFDWQLTYKPVEPIELEAGDTIRMECNWDRRLRPDYDMRYIVFADGTEDEMCFATVSFLPAAGDTARGA